MQTIEQLKARLEEAETVIREGIQTRNLQKLYFKSRYDDPVNSKKHLEQSKLQEKKFDQMAKDFVDFKPKQTTLF